MPGVFGNDPEYREMEQMMELTMQKKEEGLRFQSQRFSLTTGRRRESGG